MNFKVIELAHKRLPVKGFTLFEVLIALVIFSILAVITTSALKNIFDARDRTIAHNERLAQIQIAMALIRQDFSQALQRGVTINYINAQALEGDTQTVTFTRGGNVNPLAQEQRSTLSRIRYQFDGKQLIRHNTAQLDSPSQPQDHGAVILNNVKNTRFTYFDNKLSSLNAWTIKALPRAVRIDIELEKHGNISQLFLLPEGIHYVQTQKPQSTAR